MRSYVRSLLDEKRAPNPPPVGRLDWLLIAFVSLVSVLSFVFEPDVSYRPAAGVIAAVGIAALWFRRDHPMWALLAGFLPQVLIHLVALVFGRETPVLGSAGIVGLVLVYSVVRWATGRDIAVAMLVVVVANFVFESGVTDPGWVTATANLVPWFLAAAVGLVMRYRARLRERRTYEARLEERQQLARELHDTVAHHVSAIAIQAQAGQAVLANDPAAVSRVLATIEQTASETLTEMRRMVGVLRSDEAATTPQSGLRQVQGLASEWPGGIDVDVDMVGDLEGVADGVESAIYRIAQESVTNAQRHARHATRVRVEVRGELDVVMVTIADDGDSVSQSGSWQGYGLVGMEERARLLGGSLTAGPGEIRGWDVTATLPREGQT